MMPSSKSCMIDVGTVGFMSNVYFTQYSRRFVEFFRLVEITWIHTRIFLWVLFIKPIQSLWQERTTNSFRSLTIAVSLSWVTPTSFLDSAIMFVYEGCFCGFANP